jgi:mono/diheme cytochrome c family protein
MRLRSIGVAAATLAVAALGSPAVGQAPAPAGRGAAIFAERCKECHESGDDRAPSRQQLAAKKTEEIVAALTAGPMAAVAEGLTPEDKQAVAAYLTAH